MLWLWACSSPETKTVEEPVAPAPAAAADPVQDFRALLGVMARSEDDTCAGIVLADDLVTRAATDPALNTVLEGTPGFRRTKNGTVAIDWVELGHASGGGSMEVVTVTLGGIEAAARRDCLDVDSLANWLGRSPAFTKISACSQTAVRKILRRTLAPLPERPCICKVPDPDPTPKMLASLEQIGLTDVPAVATWSQGPNWRACPTEP